MMTNKVLRNCLGERLSLRQKLGNYSSPCGHRSVHAGINLTRNYGQHNALLCGIRTARPAVIFTMDDDLQHQPEEIPRLLARERDLRLFTQRRTANSMVFGAPSHSASLGWRCFLLGR